MERTVSVRERACRPSLESVAWCSAPGCKSLTQRSSGLGLSNKHCKRHVEFYRRHGSYWHRSFLASDLKPYRVGARYWLRANSASLDGVLRRLDAMMRATGEPLSAYDIRHLTPKEKARVALARLAAVGTTGTRLLEIALAVSARVVHRGPHGSHEFLLVQIAKAAHRLASGTHWTRSRLHRLPSKYAHSAGMSLRIMGKAIWEIAAVAFGDDDVAAVIASAEPAVFRYLAKQERASANRSAYQKEIERARALGLGPERLAAYDRQLRRQYGIEAQ